MAQYVLTFGASTSSTSINAVLAKYAASFLKDMDMKLIDLNDFEMPIYSIDREQNSGTPQGAVEFKELIKQSTGIIISLAEHNGSYTAAFKNILDWVSRLEGKVWESKPMMLLSTSPGGRGGKTVLDAASLSFPHLGAKLVGSMSVPFFHKNYNIHGITDSAILTDLKLKLKALEEIMSH